MSCFVYSSHVCVCVLDIGEHRVVEIHFIRITTARKDGISHCVHDIGEHRVFTSCISRVTFHLHHIPGKTELAKQVARHIHKDEKVGVVTR